MKVFCLFVSLFFVKSSFSLEIDEKLTARILSTSQTKKTVLMNRGIEDGLVIGDHAKLFLTTGVIARAVVVKASPSRTIWSVYRIIVPSSVVNGKVINLKISTPVTITSDKTKALRVDKVVDTIPGYNKDSVDTEDINLSASDKNELSSLNNGAVLNSALYSKTRKTLEVFGILNMSALSGTWEEGEVSDSTSNSSLDFSLGLEKYFNMPKSFFNDVSLFAVISKRSLTNGVQVQTTTDWFEYGAGANWHFYNQAFSLERPIGFITTSFGIGSAVSESSVDGITTNTTGSSNYLSFGAGGKYNLKNNFGARFIIDYFSSGTTLSSEVSDSQTVALSGLRIRFGFGYRF